MSAIAEMLRERGDTVTGSDRQENDAVRRLRAAGVNVAVGHEAGNVNGADVVVYSAAITQDNPEMVEARRRGLPVFERPELLGKLMQPYKRRIAISGTHGKTTTTSMVDAILERAGLDPTSLIGTDRANFRLGASSIILTEACEAFGSFLHFPASIAAITNIDADHLDHYGTIERIEDSFRQFVRNVDADGCVVAYIDDPRVRKALDGCGRRVVWFGLSDSADIAARDVDVSTPQAAYTLVCDGEPLGRVQLGVPGEQNVVDSLAAIGVAFELGVGFDVIRDALREFHGAARRFEILHDGDVVVVDDYAHHPAEIEATIKSSRAAYGRRIVAVFQPHLYSRTQHLLGGFAQALSLADEVIVTPIYAAREEPIEGVSGECIVDAMQSLGFAHARYEEDVNSLPEELAASVRPGDLVLVLGAGDIRAVGERLAEFLAGGGCSRQR